jgi:hypothetical protein
MKDEFFAVTERHWQQVNGGTPDIWENQTFIRASAVVAYVRCPEDRRDWGARTCIHLVSQKAVWCSETPEQVADLLK